MLCVSTGPRVTDLYFADHVVEMPSTCPNSFSCLRTWPGSHCLLHSGDYSLVKVSSYAGQLGLAVIWFPSAREGALLGKNPNWTGTPRISWYLHSQAGTGQHRTHSFRSSRELCAPPTNSKISSTGRMPYKRCFHPPITHSAHSLCTRYFTY